MVGGTKAKISTLLEGAVFCKRFVRSAVTMWDWNLLSTGCCKDVKRLLGGIVDFSGDVNSGRQPLEFTARGGCNMKGNKTPEGIGTGNLPL
jgi:hypothetical protein